jgi:cyclic lactone autoinducer peptide
MAINYFMVFLGGSLGAVCRFAISIQMKRIISIASKILLLLAPIALTTAINSAGSMCMLWSYQPQEPAALSKLTK